jgi:hypothetical protein
MFFKYQQKNDYERNLIKNKYYITINFDSIIILDYLIIYTIYIYNILINYIIYNSMAKMDRYIIMTQIQHIFLVRYPGEILIVCIWHNILVVYFKSNNIFQKNFLRIIFKIVKKKRYYHIINYEWVFHYVMVVLLFFFYYNNFIDCII